MIASASRRQWLGTAAALGLGLHGAARGVPGARPGARHFTMDLVCGAIGVRANLPEAIELAAAHGFESVAPDAGYLATIAQAERDAFLADLKARGLTFGAAALAVDFRGDDAAFRKGMEELPRAAAALQAFGVTRMGTWLRPNHDRLTYLANFRQHAERLRTVATVLGDHGLRLGLEYVGPKTSWTAARYPFIHTLAETRELIAEIDRPNVGLVLDSWHWYTAGETEAELLSLKNADVVACDLNDAPAGIPVDQQRDSRRDLPAATGVIDLKTFLGALIKIGYDGPVRAEPFKSELASLPKEEAVSRTAAAMKKAFALIEQP